MGFAYILDSGKIDAEFQNFGFASLQEANSFHSVDQYARHLATLSGSKPSSPPSLNTSKRFNQTRNHSQKLANAALYTVSTLDPMNQLVPGLNESPDLSPEAKNYLDPKVVENLQFVNPESIQSSQSPAAYLAYIYRLANAEISVDNEEWTLDARRPDLKSFELSMTNMEEKVTTLQLVNDVLSSQVAKAMSLNNESQLLAQIKSLTYPISLPMDENYATIRESLKIMDGLNLTKIAFRGQQNFFPLHENFLASYASPLDHPKLYPKHVDIFWTSYSMEGDNAPLYRDLFGMESDADGQAILQNATEYCTALEISIDELQQLVCGFRLVDETGTERNPKDVYFTPLQRHLKLESENGTLVTKMSTDSISFKDFDKYTHECHNKFIRIQRRSTLTIAQLNWLFAATLNPWSSATMEQQVFRSHAIHVIGNFQEWHERYDISLNEFVAIIAEINCYRYDGDKQPSLMREIFGGDASRVTKATQRIEGEYLRRDEIEIDGLGDILRRGFTMNRLEWDTVISSVLQTEEDLLNHRAMARIFRISFLFGLFDWPILQGMQLLAKMDPQLAQSFTTENSNISVIDVINRFACLAEWADENGFSVNDLTIIFSEASDETLVPDQSTLNWVQELQHRLYECLVVSSDFSYFTTWTDDNGNRIIISEEAWMTGLQEKNIVDHRGLVVGQRNDVLAAVGEVSASVGSSSSSVNDENKNRLQQLTGMIIQKKKEQNDAVLNAISSRDTNTNSLSISPLLIWMGSDEYKVAAVFIDWDLENSAKSDDGMTLLQDIDRHLLISKKLRLEPVEIQTVALMPTWVSLNMNTEFSLYQLFILSHYKRMLKATSGNVDLWMAYLVLANSPDSGTGLGTKDDRKTEYHMLCELLGWPAKDIEALAVGEAIGIHEGRITNIEQLIYVHRRIQLCKDTGLSAEELIAVEALNIIPQDLQAKPSFVSDASAAVGGLKIGLQKEKGEDACTKVDREVEEELRDALRSLFRESVIKRSEDLKETIKTEEDVFQYLLLDVNVSSEVRTTRMEEHTTSLQMFVNQALMKFHGAMSRDEDWLRSNWLTTRKYDLWAANEKLLLYPSTFIEPELRKDKTEIFRNMEQKLSESSLTQQTVNSAVGMYIEELEKLTELSVTGFYATAMDDRINVIFNARAPWEKLGFFFREVDINRQAVMDGSPYGFVWGDWKRLDLPLFSDEVPTVISVRAWGSMFALWVELEKDISDPKNTEKYVIKPRYCRRGMDGIYSQAHDATVSSSVSMIIADKTKVTGLEVYQPVFDIEQNQVLCAIRIQLGDSEKLLGWRVCPEGSEEEIYSIPEFGNPWSMDGYATIPQFSVPPKTEETIETGSDEEIKTIIHPYEIEGSVEQKKIYGSLFDFESYNWNIEKDASNPMELTINWKASGCTLYNEWNNYYVERVYASVQPFTAVNQPERAESIIEVYPNPDHIYLETFQLDLQDAEFSNFAITENTATIRLKIFGDPYGASPEALSTDIVTVASEGTVPGPNMVYFDESAMTAPRPNAQRFMLRNTMTDADIPTWVFQLSSQALKDVARSAKQDKDHVKTFSMTNQSSEEVGTKQFLTEVEKFFHTLAGPKPQLTLDFNGPYGIYAWELFYYLPSLVSTKCRQAGQYEQALYWLDKIYNPYAKDSSHWNFLPFATPYPVGLYASNDPDQVGRERVHHYQVATCTDYLGTIIDKGDSLYRLCTKDSLKEAKMSFLQAKQLFSDNNVRSPIFTMEEWQYPKLGSVTDSDFRPPINAEFRDAYKTVCDRLDNLREWRSIDGMPFNMPMKSPEVHPRSLQAVPITASVPMAAPDFFPSSWVHLPFHDCLGRAMSAVRNVMYMGDLVSKSLYQRDAVQTELMERSRDFHVAENYALAAENDVLQNLYDQLAVLRKTREQVEVYLRYHTKFAAEFMNNYENRAIALHTIGSALNTAAQGLELATGIAKLIPDIFGTSTGGFEPSGIVEAATKVLRLKAKIALDQSSRDFRLGGFKRRQEVSQMNRDGTQKELERVDLQISQLQNQVSAQQRAVGVTTETSRRTQELLDFQSSRSTNVEFSNWYVGRISQMYSVAFDLAVRFARLAEQAFRQERQDFGTSFVKPVWDSSKSGLLSGQSLLLDLERMEVAFMEKYPPEMINTARLSLRRRSQADMDMLRENGQVMFSLTNEELEYHRPMEWTRVIDSVRVRLVGLEDKGSDIINGRLTMISHTLDHGVNESGMPPSYRRQQIALDQVVTDTADWKHREGRFRPFERCGIHSTWILSFPAVVNAIQNDTTYEKMWMLNQLVDVELLVRYTARV